MFVSHCFVNCSPASCAIKPKQNNCQRLLHLCTQTVFKQLIMAGCQSQILLLKNQLTAPCGPTSKLDLQFHSSTIHVISIHAECCNSVKVKQKCKPTKMLMNAGLCHHHSQTEVVLSDTVLWYCHSHTEHVIVPMFLIRVKLTDRLAA